MLTLENICKSSGDRQLFSEVHAIIRENDRIGLVGLNGTGKSTLLKIIAGKESPDEGKLIHAKDFTVSYLPQEEQIEEDLQVIDYIFQSELPIMQLLRTYEKTTGSLQKNPHDEKIQEQLMEIQEKIEQENAWDVQTMVQTILSKLGIRDYEKNVQHLSGGQRKRVFLAKALIEQTDLLILDEPTNHLDQETIEWLEQYLVNRKGALLVVTHDRYFLNHVTNYIYELEHGHLYMYEGNYETYLEKKMLREEEIKTAEERHKNRLRKEMEWLKRGPRARTTKQKARIERIQEMQKETFHTRDDQVEIQVGSTRLGRKVMELDQVTKRMGQKVLWKDFSFMISPDSRIGIIGSNGVGKTTFLDVLSDRLDVDDGLVTRGETVKIGYYKQGEEDLDPNQRMIDYIKEVAEVITTVEGKTITAEQMLERFLFPRRKQWEWIRSLSGGERRRLYLLKILMTEPNVLLLDEPTNDLDLQTLAVLEEYIEHFPGVVLTVSHDRYFLDRVCDILFVFDGAGNIEVFYGNYTDYLERKSKAEQKVQRKEKEKRRPKEKPKRKRLSYKDQREWDTIEDEIEKLEGKIGAIEEIILEAGDDFEKVQKLYREQQDLEEELERKLERWEELSLLVESLQE